MKVRAVVSQLTWQVALMSLAACTVFVARKIDMAFPAVQDFKVTSQKELATGGLLIEGTMDKVRDCTFTDVTAYTADGRQVYVHFLDKPPNMPPATRAVRIQAWGPWEVYSGKNQSVSLYARHQCHIFWSQTTKLADINVVLVSPKKEEAEIAELKAELGRLHSPEKIIVNPKK